MVSLAMATMLDRVFKGVVAMTSLLLSSYLGNDPYFRFMTAEYYPEKVRVRAQLVNAFENDFQEIFRSGRQIDIWYTLSFEKDEQRIWERQFHHSVKFDPLYQHYIVYLSERTRSQTVSGLPDLYRLVGSFEYIHEVPKSGNDYKNCQVRLTAKMRTIKLDSGKRELDMMVLWKNSVPEISARVRTVSNEF